MLVVTIVAAGRLSSESALRRLIAGTGCKTSSGCDGGDDGVRGGGDDDSLWLLWRDLTERTEDELDECRSSLLVLLADGDKGTGLPSSEVTDPDTGKPMPIDLRLCHSDGNEP